MMSEFITGLLKVILLLFSYGAVGYMLLFAFNKQAKSSPFYTLFLSLFTGVSTLIALVAVFKTKGMSVNVILLLVMIYLVGAVRKNKTAQVQAFASNSYLFATAVLLLGVVLIYTYCYVVFSKYYSNQDYLFYSKISYYLFTTGYENDYQIFNNISKDYHEVTPYHYFDLWLNAINHFSWHISSNMDTFLRTTSSILLVSVFAGFLAIYELYKKVNVIGVVLCLAIIFFGGFYFPFFNKIGFIEAYEYCFWPFSIFNFAKFTPTVLYFIAVFVCFKKINKLTGLLVFSTLAVVSVVNVPGVGLALAAASFMVLVSKKLRQHLSVKDSIIAFLPLLAVVVFYMFLGNKVVARGGTTSGAIGELITNLFSMSAIIQKIKIIIGAIIVIVSVYILALPAIYNMFKLGMEQAQEELFFMFLIVMALSGGLLAWSIIAPKMNAIQPFYFFLKVLPLLLFIGICTMRSGTFTNVFMIAVSLFGVWNVVHAVNKAQANTSRDIYTQQYKALIDKVNISGNIGLLKDSTDFVDITSYYPTCYSLGSPVCIHRDELFGVSLSDYEVPVTADPALDEVYKDGIKMGAFYRYVQNQKEKHTFRDIETSQLEFLKLHQMKYLITTDKIKLSPAMNAMVDTIIEMPMTNERLVKLK